MNSIYVLPEKFLDTNNFKNNKTGLSFRLKIIFQTLKFIIKKWVFFNLNIKSQDNAYFELKFWQFFIQLFLSPNQIYMLNDLH